MCADIHLEENEFSVLLAETPWSFIRLNRNQPALGYVVVALKRHACELFELDPEELAGFWADVARVAGALERICKPVKLDYLVMGHMCPHVHCHVLALGADHDPSIPGTDLLGRVAPLDGVSFASLRAALSAQLTTP